MRRRIALALLPLVACTNSPRGDSSFESGMSASAGSSSTTEGGESTSDEDSTSTTGDGSSTGNGPGGPILDVGAPDTDGTPGEIAEVFGHSGSILYRMDADTKEVMAVGPFTGVLQGSIIDIALDEDSNMYGTTYGALYTIDKETAECTLIAEGDYPTSLSFVPAGTVDPDVEALVGYVDAEYIRIDVETGDVTSIGSLTDGLESSGDIVSVKEGGTYLTVTGPGCDTGDCLVEVDPVTGDMIENFGVLPYEQVFGLAFWGGIAYGFARDGVLFQIDFFANGTIASTPIMIPGGAQVEWFGAGSTTSAPAVAG